MKKLLLNNFSDKLQSKSKNSLEKIIKPFNESKKIIENSRAKVKTLVEESKNLKQSINKKFDETVIEVKSAVKKIIFQTNIIFHLAICKRYYTFEF